MPDPELFPPVFHSAGLKKLFFTVIFVISDFGCLDYR